MAGSYKHATDDQGRLRARRTMTNATETQSDAYETIEEMYGMIWFLADGDAQKVEEARVSYEFGHLMSPGFEEEY